MRHIYTKKILHLNFLTTNMKLMVSVLVIVVALMLIFKCKKYLGISFITLLTVIYIWLPFTNDMLVYTYGIGVMLWMDVLESILIITSTVRRR